MARAMMSLLRTSLALSALTLGGCHKMQWVRVPLPVPAAGAAAVTFIGHATTLIQIDGTNLLTDPNLNDHVAITARRRAASVTAKDLPRLDAVLISHAHRDHLDEWTLRQLPRNVPIFISRGNGARLREWGFTDVREMDVWDACTVGTVRIIATPAKHSGARNSPFADTPKALGFLVRGHRTIYFAGDTGLFDGFNEIGRRADIDLALLPIGGYRPRWFMKSHHMSPADALRAMTMLRAREMVPIHWGSFRMASEGVDEPKQVLLRLIAGGDIEARVHVLENGESLLLPH